MTGMWIMVTLANPRGINPKNGTKPIKAMIEMSNAVKTMLKILSLFFLVNVFRLIRQQRLIKIHPF